MVLDVARQVPAFDPTVLSSAVEVASGSGATVYRAKLPNQTHAPLDVAVRRPRITSIAALERFEMEVAIRARLDHPSILPLIAANARPPHYCTVSPWVAGGDAFEAVHSRGIRFSFTRLLSLARNLTAAVAHIHSRGIVHRDIKTANLLLSNSFEHAYLADLDLAVDVEQLKMQAGIFGGRAAARGPSNGRLKHMVGTLVYLAPEVIKGAPHSFAADVYALAVTLNEMAAAAVPYVDRKLPAPELHTVLETRFNHLQLRAAITSEGLRPRLAKSVPARFSKLIEAAWHPDPSKRPTSQQFMEELDAIAALGEEYLEQFGAAADDPLDAQLADGTRKLSTEASLVDHFNAASATLSPPRWRVESPTGYNPVINSALSSTSGGRGDDRMEDRAVVASPLVAGSDMHLLAVFDGHGGSACAEFAHNYIVGALALAWDNVDATPASALISAFETVDRAFLFNSPRSEESGATALAAMVFGGRLYVANAGDCRAVLGGTDGSATALSTDHVATDEAEALRVAARGGSVVNGRVGGRLLVSRALGDRPIKQFVAPTPDITETILGPQHDFVILASDGLWDVVDNAYACELVRTTVRVADMAAKRLALKAIELGSDDNISVIVAFLRNGE